MFVTRRTPTGAQQTPLATAGFGGSYPLDKAFVPGLVQVLADKMIPLTNQPYGANLSAPGHRYIDLKYKFSIPLTVEFNATSSNWNNTQIYIASISDSGAVPNPGFTLGNFQCRYYDD